jgi:hypothetical protein
MTLSLTFSSTSRLNLFLSYQILAPIWPLAIYPHLPVPYYPAVLIFIWIIMAIAVSAECRRVWADERPLRGYHVVCLQKHGTRDVGLLTNLLDRGLRRHFAASLEWHRLDQHEARVYAYRTELARKITLSDVLSAGANSDEEGDNLQVENQSLMAAMGALKARMTSQREFQTENLSIEERVHLRLMLLAFPYAYEGRGGQVTIPTLYLIVTWQALTPALNPAPNTALTVALMGALVGVLLDGVKKALRESPGREVSWQRRKSTQDWKEVWEPANGPSPMQFHHDAQDFVNWLRVVQEHATKAPQFLSRQMEIKKRSP